MRIALNYRNVDPDRGGAETYVADLTRSLIARGHQVTLVAESVKSGCVPVTTRILKVPVKGFGRSSKIWSFARNSEAVLRAHETEFDATMGFINTWHHDVIIPQGGLRAGSILHNAERFRSPLRRTVYGALKRLSPSEWKYDRIEREQYSPERKARVVAVSRLVAGHLERFRGVDPERIHVVYNAIDPDRFHVDDHDAVRQETRQKYGLTADEHVGLFVGHNFWLKGLEPLLRAMARHKAKAASKTDSNCQPLRLLVSGRGKLKPFHKMVDQLGLQDEVLLLGFTPDIRSLFHASDFFVSPTYYDPCSLVVMEALACGLPVITTSCNGAGEIMTNGREGFVVPSPNHEQELTAALSQMTDRQLRHEMARNATELGRAQTFEVHVSHLEAIFREVATNKRPQHGESKLGLSNPHFQAINEHSLNPSKESDRGRFS
ncbi:MAG: hypothetical protein RJA81_490 [Planctomycetota bacterium]|jgi:UDP-glucose:(heptosyl)LPS alpha-1,3-glucosyltransferase